MGGGISRWKMEAVLTCGFTCSNASVTLSLEAKLHLLHSYMNVRWITLPCDMQVKGPGGSSLPINYSALLSTGKLVRASPGGCLMWGSVPTGIVPDLLSFVGGHLFPGAFHACFQSSHDPEAPVPLRDAPHCKQTGAVGLWPPQDWDKSHSPLPWLCT